MDGDLRITREEDGDVSFGPALDQKEAAGVPAPQGQNIALIMEDGELDAISDSLTETIAFDEEGQAGWEEIATEVFDLLGLGLEAKSDIDDEEADNSSHTLMLEAVLNFQAKALSVLLPTDDMPVRTKPVKDPEEIEDDDKRAAYEEDMAHRERRVQRFYRDYLFKRLPSYEADTDQILADMGRTGTGIRKIVVDATRKETPVMPEHVEPGRLIISYASKDFRNGRIVDKIDMPTSDIIRRIQSGKYRPVRLSDGQSVDVSPITAAKDEIHGRLPGHYENSETHRVYEVYGSFIFTKDLHPQRLPRPYIITIHAQSRQVLCIERNWDVSDPDEQPLEHYVAYIYHPGKSSIQGVGLGQILLQVTRSLRSAQRRALEAAYLQNHPSGFKLSNLSIREGDTRIRSGEFVDVDSPTGDIRQALMIHPFMGPSPGLMALSDKMEENGRKLAGTASFDFSALLKAGIAAGPAMAAYEESTEFQTAVHRRLYLAHRRELEIIHDRLRVVLGGRVKLFGVDQVLHKDDLMMVDVLPYMKPGQASRQKTLIEAQAIWDLARENPDIMDRRAAAEIYIGALSSPDANRVLLPDPEDEEAIPHDPVTEYANLMAGKPLRAGIAQNHQAHIDAHGAQLRMLQVSQLPLERGDAASAALAAHIAEHMGMQMMVQVASRVGISPEQLGPNMSPQIETAIAGEIAQAVIQMEQERRPADGEGEKVAVEGVRQQAATQREMLKAQDRARSDMQKAEAERQRLAMQQQHEAEMERVKQEHARELQRLKDEAAMQREIEDNAAAIRIAQMRGAGKSAGADAGATS